MLVVQLASHYSKQLGYHTLSSGGKNPSVRFFCCGTVSLYSTVLINQPQMEMQFCTVELFHLASGILASIIHIVVALLRSYLATLCIAVTLS